MSTSPGPLEVDFQNAVLDAYREARKVCNYHAKAFLDMVITHTAVKAAKTLLATSDIQSGLYELEQCGRLDLSVEHLVLTDKYRALFTDKERAEAERRLALMRADD